MTLQEELEAEAKNILLLPHPWLQMQIAWQYFAEIDPRQYPTTIAQ